MKRNKKQNYSDEQIKDYLVNHIKQSIENDVGIAIKGYMKSFFDNGPHAGFFAVPRMLFPEIDGLGSYITGKPLYTGLNIKIYLSEVMSKIDVRYKDYAGFIVLIYRNGLLHQHSPKKFKFKRKEISWQFGVSNVPVDIQRRNHLTIQNNTLKIDMNIFYNDVINSVDILVKMILDGYR
ncbi:hypothetical protein MYX06_05135, partial [Patescibacteria group bacterium AH-259-L05]|nr:hypothetical protein [Patescibacteria group bacterium AH-259-L05]